MNPLTTIFQQIQKRDEEGRFSAPLALADAGILTWLLTAFHRFRNLPVPDIGILVGLVSCVVALAWACGLHRDWKSRSVAFIAKACLFIFLTDLALHLAAQSAAPNKAISLSLTWLAVTTGAFVCLGRAVYWKLRAMYGWAPLETPRWIALGLGATWVLWPLYNTKTNGSGDAYWYLMMLSDYLEQTRHGIFPVWIGQTEYAFNGAFSPLRLAPGFQHAGGILDILTCRALDYLVVKNLLLVITPLLAGYSAYFCLRSMLPTRPNIACGLGLVYLLSPGLITPLANGDQYMTFLAAPYLPLALYGSWRVIAKNDLAGHIILAVGVSALWLFHTPVALWTSMLASALYMTKLALHWRSGRELKFLATAAFVYVALGTHPIVSALAIDNTVAMPIVGLQVFEEVKAVFPAIFKPLVANGSPANYQPGYTALAAGLVGLFLSLHRREPASLAFSGACLALLAFMVPMPGISEFIWRHMPSIVAKITNVWLYQRLSLIWAGFLVFTLAAALAAKPTAAGPTWLPIAAGILGLVAMGWSVREASILRDYFPRNIPTGPGWEVALAKHNLLLSRYPYSSFASTPPYFSHSYMEPRLESRLLRRSDCSILLSAADSAASAGSGRQLLAGGVLRAVNDNNSTFYLLQPAPTIQPSTHYALRLDFIAPGERGYLQVRGERLFREYIMPDSGVGMNTAGQPPRSFGSTPTSASVMPLYTDASGPTLLRLTYILPDRPVTPEFEAARYQIWSYEPSQLPINVHTLLPYRATVDSPEPAYLESPRMWLSGYRAIVNHKRIPIIRSPNNLCMVEVEQGRNEIEIKFKPTLRLEISYWITFWGWSVALVVGIWQLWRRPSVAD